MKKQNVNNKLAFNKAMVVELNDGQMYDVDGGTTPVCIAAAASSVGCAAIAGAAAALVVCYLVD